MRERDMHYVVDVPSEGDDGARNEDPASLQVDMECKFRLASMDRKVLDHWRQ